MALAAAWCLLLGATASAAAEAPTLEWEPVAEGLTSPVELVEPDDGTGRLLVVDQVGLIHIVDPDAGLQDTPFLDLSNELAIRDSFDERGLLGLAMHPDFPEDDRFYVYYSAPLREGGAEGFDHTSRVSEFRVSEDDPNRADSDSQRVLLEIDQPEFNHNGGAIAFGPNDGYLYIGLGDGGGANDTGELHPPQGNGQDITTLLGSILRIDVEPDSDQPYGIPQDNPFAGDDDGRDEIYAYGLRNTWGMSFDTDGNEVRLFAADIGQDLYETVNLIERGGNYGWNIREGFHCFDPDNPTDPPENCPEHGERGEPLLDPIIEYPNLKVFADDPEAFGRSVTGGHVYRGQAIPELQGRYIFADWSRTMSPAEPEGIALIAEPPESGDPRDRWTVSPLETAAHPEGRMQANMTAIGRDAEGEIYLLTNENITPTGDTGKVHRLVPVE